MFSSKLNSNHAAQRERTAGFRDAKEKRKICGDEANSD
jgi:hypothetical protein